MQQERSRRWWQSLPSSPRAAPTSSCRRSVVGSSAALRSETVLLYVLRIIMQSVSYDQLYCNGIAKSFVWARSSLNMNIRSLYDTWAYTCSTEYLSNKYVASCVKRFSGSSSHQSLQQRAQYLYHELHHAQVVQYGYTGAEVNDNWKHLQHDVTGVV